jgi:multidrug resistance efflux pump
METKQAYEEKTKAQLKHLNARIQVLRAKAEVAKADAKVRYAEQLEELEKRQKEAETRLEQLQVSGRQAWRELKDGVDNAVTELERSLTQALSQFD